MNEDMNKKDYQKPVLRVVKMKMLHHLLAGSDPVQRVGGNVFNSNSAPAGSSGTARSRSNDWWDDEE